MAIEVELFDDLDAVAADAAGALDRSAQPLIFHRIEWFRRTFAQCPPPGRLLVARARDAANGDACWLFLAVEGGVGRLLASWYSLVCGFVDHPAGAPRAALRSALLDRLADLRPAIDRLEIELGDGESLPPSVRWMPASETAIINWTADTGGARWDQYWTERPARLRNTVARKTKNVSADICIFKQFDPDAWTDYEDIYAASWKPAEGSPQFLRGLAEAEGAAGTLRMGMLRHEGRAVAAQFWLVEAGRATIHKLAYRADSSALSPGTLLSAAMFRAIIEEDRPTIIDYGTGDEPYKRDWMDRRSARRRIMLANRSTVRGLAGGIARRAKALVAPPRRS